MKTEINIPEKMLKYIQNNSLSNENCIMLLYPLVCEKKLYIDDIAEMLNVKKLDVIKLFNYYGLKIYEKYTIKDFEKEVKQANKFLRKELQEKN